MFCAQCQSPNAADNKFCSECGFRLTSPSTVSGSPEVVQLLSRALTSLEQGHIAEAHASVDAALALDPESSSAHSVRGILFEREGRIAEAIREFEVVVAKNPYSSADLAKLQALQGNTTQSLPPRPRWNSQWNSQRIMLASALAAGLVVFSGGILMISQSARPQNSDEGKGSTATLQPATSTLAPATGTPSPTPPRSLPALSTAPPPSGTTLTGPPAPPIRAATGNPATPVFPAPGRQALLRPANPLAPTGTPPAGNAGGRNSPMGLPPAAIGEVIPLPQTPATAPGGPNIASAAVAPPGTTGGSPAAPAAAPQAAEPVKAPADVEQKSRVEPLEPETGFIKIEPLKGAGDARSGSAGTIKTTPASISVEIASSGGDEAAIAEAQRAQRNAFNAARQANLEDAERQYRQAASLYEQLVRRGGSTARQAREGLDACRKALAALR